MPKKLSKSSLSSPITSTFSADSSTPTSPTIVPATNTTTSPTPRPPRTLTDGLPLPRLIVFDLDYTLWPFWVDTHVSPPLKPSPGSAHTLAVDKHGETFAFYRDVPTVLTALRAAGIKIGAASRTHAPELGKEMLRLLHLPEAEAAGGKEGRGRKALEVFDYVEIYPADKRTHFERIRKNSGVELREVLFFDDESRNRNVEALGVTMWLVRDGVSSAEVDAGVWEWRKRRGYGGRPKEVFEE